jgi:perosamine synthetase
MDLKINFSGRSIRYTEEEIAVVVEAMRNADPLTQGAHMRAFEEKFAAYQGVANGSCFTTMNGCAALELSAQLCRFEPGDEVVMPSHTFTASAYPYLKKGARLVWADVDLQTRVLTAESIEAVLTPRTRAVVVVHLYGYVADMPAIAALCKKRGLLLIEDAAQSIGAEVDGRKSGSFADMAIFSFHSHKNLTTLGEGGMLYVRDPKLAALVPMLRHNGHCAFDFERPDYWKPAMGNVDLPLLEASPLQPNNYCLGEVECALGAKLLDRIDSINDEKRARAIRFIDALADFPQLEFHREESRRHNYHLLAARMRSGTEARDQFMRQMFVEKGVKCVVQYLPLDRYDYYRRQGLGQSNCPNADLFYDTMISFPFQHWLSEEELDYMLDASRAVLSGMA